MDDLPGLILLSLRFILALILYAFLFWAFRTIWLDLKQTSRAREEREIPPLNVAVKSGIGPAASQALVSPINILGRASENDICIPDSTISSQHARIYFDHKQWWVEDLASSNGTFLNEVRLTQPAVLVTGDHLRLGKIIIEVEIPS